MSPNELTNALGQRLARCWTSSHAAVPAKTMYFVHICSAQGLANEKTGLIRHAAERDVQQQEATRTILA